MKPESDDWRHILIRRRADFLRERMAVAADERELLGQDVTELAERSAEQTLASVLDALGARDLAHLQEIADAILRLDAGRFGRCVDCTAPIAIERLRAYPEAARCSACASIREGAGRSDHRHALA